MLPKLVFAALFLVGSCHAQWLQATYLSDVTSCSGSEEVQAFIPMGKCIQIPQLPPNATITIPFKSFKSECTQNADGSISTSNKVYSASSTCDGRGVPLNEDIPAGCQDGALFQCVPDISTSTALSANWPAAGAYFGSSSCAAYDLLISMAPDTCIALTDSDGSSYSALMTEVDGSSFDVKVFDGVVDCTGTPNEEISTPEGICSQVIYGQNSNLQQQFMLSRAGYGSFPKLLSQIMPNIPMTGEKNKDYTTSGQESNDFDVTGSAEVYIYASHIQNIK